MCMYLKEITPSPITHYLMAMLRTIRTSVTKSTLLSVLKDYTNNYIRLFRQNKVTILQKFLPDCVLFVGDR